MANKPIIMLKIRRILQLHSQGISNRDISQQLGVNRNTVNRYVQRAVDSGRQVDQLQELPDEDLSLLMHQEVAEQLKERRYVDFQQRCSDFVSELKKKHVTRQVLWQEYRMKVPDGYSYSQFCQLLGEYLLKKKAVMKFEHEPGAKMMFDFAGDKLAYFDPQKQEPGKADVLICTLPFSAMIYAEALPNQTREELFKGLNNALQYFGGVPQVVISDNLGQWVKKANRYEPSFNELAQQWALHYGCELMAARVRKPRDKASVESSVNTIYNRIYALLRNELPVGIQGLNASIRPLLDKLNHQKLQREEQSRWGRFVDGEQALLKPLVAPPFVIYHQADAKVQLNYHVMLGEDQHYYSVPYVYLGKTIRMIYDLDHVKIYLPNHQLIATHKRDRTKHKATTLDEHRAPNHYYYNQMEGYTIEEFTSRAARVGPYCVKAVEAIMKRQEFVEQNFRSCEGLLRLANKVGSLRMENACKRVLTASKVTYLSVKSILEKHLDEQPQLDAFEPPPHHNNIRGPQAYE